MDFNLNGVGLALLVGGMIIIIMLRKQFITPPAVTSNVGKVGHIEWIDDKLQFVLNDYMPNDPDASSSD